MICHEAARRYSIEIRDIEAEQTLVLTAVEWSMQELRGAVARVLGEAGVPHAILVEKTADAERH
jgi:hypothetical protein